MRLLACLLAMVIAGCGRSGAGGNANSTSTHDAGASRTDDAGAATNDAGVDAGPASNFDAGSPQGAVCPAGLGDAGNFASGGGDLDNSVGSTDCDGSTLPPVRIPLAIEEGPFGHYNRCMGGTTDGSGQLAADVR